MGSWEVGGHGDGIHFRSAVKKPQVLVLVDWYKPFFKAGGPVRSLVNMVEHLHDRIGFHFVTGDRDYMADHRSEEVRTDGWINLLLATEGRANFTAIDT